MRALDARFFFSQETKFSAHACNSLLILNITVAKPTFNIAVLSYGLMSA